MKFILTTWWPFSIIAIAFGCFWAFYGFLEYIGFGDGGAPPSEDIKILVSGLYIAAFGIVLLVNLIVNFGNKGLSKTFFIISLLPTLFVATFSILGGIDSAKEGDLYRLGIFIFLFFYFIHFPLVTAYLIRK